VTNSKYPPNPDLSAEEVADQQQKLIATTFAKADFTLAAETVQRLITLRQNSGSDFLSSWTVLAISYSRPFTKHGCSMTLWRWVGRSRTR